MENVTQETSAETWASLKIERPKDFPDGPVAKIPPSQCRGPRFDTQSGN